MDTIRGAIKQYLICFLTLRTTVYEFSMMVLEHICNKLCLKNDAFRQYINTLCVVVYLPRDHVGNDLLIRKTISL